MIESGMSRKLVFSRENKYTISIQVQRLVGILFCSQRTLTYIYNLNLDTATTLSNCNTRLQIQFVHTMFPNMTKVAPVYDCSRSNFMDWNGTRWENNGAWPGSRIGEPSIASMLVFTYALPTRFSSAVCQRKYILHKRQRPFKFRFPFEENTYSSQLWKRSGSYMEEPPILFTPEIYFFRSEALYMWAFQTGTSLISNTLCSSLWVSKLIDISTILYLFRVPHRV